MISAYYPQSFTQWGNQESWPQLQSVLVEPGISDRSRPSSLTEVRSIDAVMEEFRQNGFDSPYDPEEEVNLYKYRKSAALAGMGPPSARLRRKSWPASDATPAVPLPFLSPLSSLPTLPSQSSLHSLPVLPAAGDCWGLPTAPADVEEASSPLWAQLTEEQIRVLNSLPSPVLSLLLKEVESYRAQCARRAKPEVIECRFCKNNGEKESYYRSHRLRSHGRVTCPVLRAYSCRRCGARGDHAHTLKYCPFTTEHERTKSTNMMRSIRQGSSRRRNWKAPSSDFAANYEDMYPGVTADGAAYNMYDEPLDPIWEALAAKLML